MSIKYTKGGLLESLLPQESLSDQLDPSSRPQPAHTPAPVKHSTPGWASALPPSFPLLLLASVSSPD